jgi:hypothetical protein
MKNGRLMIVGGWHITISLILLTILTQTLWIQLFPFSPLISILAYGFAIFLLLLGVILIVKGLKADH